MKQKLICKLLSFCLFVAILGLTSCQDETIDASEEEMLEEGLLTSKKKNKKGPGVTFDMSQSCYVTSKTDLYAGQNILVGNVSVSENGGMFTITYNLSNGYCLTETHLSVVESPEDFPMGGGGNPKNGHFEYSKSHDCVSSYSYEVPTSKGSYIAAHAVVNCVSEPKNPSEDIEASLPINAEICTADGPDTNSYFDITVKGDSFLAGDYNAWCIDFYKILNDSQCLNADLVSLLDDSVKNAVYKPQNLGAVNWLLNQDFISQGYTFGEIQWAIWELIEDDSEKEYCCLGDWEESNGETIVAMALENLDFVPACDDLYGIAVLPTDESIQPLVIAIPIECDTTVGDCEETAWGDGCDFPGNNWATYFQYSPE